MAEPTNFETAVKRLKDINDGIVDPNTDPKCWLCGSERRDVRKSVLQYASPSGWVGTGDTFNLECVGSADCSSDWHDVKAAA